MQQTELLSSKLFVSRLNMRAKRGTPDVSDLLPSVRTRGILQPLLVRPAADDSGRFEIIAGMRRFHANRIVEQETGEPRPLPVIIMAPGDDAAALEASMLENFARLDPDEVTQWETFGRLQRGGRTVSDIAFTFGLTELYVKQRLAFGNLIPKLRELYRDEKVDGTSLRFLTLASQSRQRQWLALFENPKERAPTGASIKHWLFGGNVIETSVALFPLERYAGPLSNDLFSTSSVFGNADAFWLLQDEAIAAKRAELLTAGWSDVIVLERGQRFDHLTHVHVSKKDGGKIFIASFSNGSVQIHEGFLSKKEAKRRTKATGGTTTAVRNEVSAPLQNYLDLHRHIAVRSAVIKQPKVGLRLFVASAIIGSDLWRVEAEPQTPHNEAIAASIGATPNQAAFLERRRAVRKQFGIDTATRSGNRHTDLVALLRRLMTFKDADVIQLATVIMAETLAVDGRAIDALGRYLGVEMAKSWTPDDAFFDLVRDRSAVNAMVAEVAGTNAAKEYAAAKLKDQKVIIRDALAGRNGRTKATGWVPKWMRFPSSTYAKSAAEPATAKSKTRVAA